MFTGDEPIWLPFPMASVAAALLAVIGIGAALVKRETTAYGQHVETSLFEALLYLNAGPVFHRPGHRPRVIRQTRSPILHTYATRDGRGMQINLSGTERWREVARLIELEDDGGLDFSDVASLAKLSDREWCDRMRGELGRRFAERTADEWEEALLRPPAAVAKCSTLEEWVAHAQVAGQRCAVPERPRRASAAYAHRRPGQDPPAPRWGERGVGGSPGGRFVEFLGRSTCRTLLG